MKKTEKGFTIIEVALVLAIGALIFLVVFLAVPALQRNQRNDARKRDISNVVEAVTDYNSNNPTQGLNETNLPYYYDNSGSLKKDANTLGKYLDTLSSNIKKVEIKAQGGLPSKPDAGTAEQIFVVKSSQCNGLHDVKAAPGRKSAVVGTVENNSGYEFYCQDAS